MISDRGCTVSGRGCTGQDWPRKSRLGWSSNGPFRCCSVVLLRALVLGANPHPGPRAQLDHRDGLAERLRRALQTANHSRRPAPTHVQVDALYPEGYVFLEPPPPARIAVPTRNSLQVARSPLRRLHPTRRRSLTPGSSASTRPWREGVRRERTSPHRRESPRSRCRLHRYFCS